MSGHLLSEQLRDVPDVPGVYLWRDARGRVLYVGKAKELRKRMRQYLTGQDERVMVPLLMGQTASYDYLETDNEVESLILEKSLIRQFHPPYNVDYRDDKTYPFIALTMGDPFPAIKYTREKHRSGTRYFGPYTDAKAARETIDVVRRVHSICRATCVEWKRVNARGGEPSGKACFDHHVGRGPGPCVGAITPEAYAVHVERAIAFLEGRHSGVLAGIERDMRAAAANLDFERAARLRNSLEAVRKVLERQNVVSQKSLDMDVIGIFREETIAGVHVFVVREGRVLIGNEFVLDKGLDVPLSELVEGFLLRHYGEEAARPAKQVLLPALPPEPGAVEAWLSALRGTRVSLRVPERGDKKRLTELAETNARHTLARFKARTRYDDERANAALAGLQVALGLPRAPLRIECFDISTLHGRHSVGSMVVFKGGRADTRAYRRFRVRAETPESDDVAMMGEVLRRRFARERDKDGRFASPPDLVIVDGGKPQLSAAVAALRDSGVDVPAVALAKREEEVFVPGRPAPVLLSAGSPALYLVKRVRDEAHRFAVEYHRDLRGKQMTASVLDTVPGVGPTRRRTLMRAFGSVKRLREASVDEIAAVRGIPLAVAERVAAALAHKPGGDRRG